jgi:hypothetical protein
MTRVIKSRPLVSTPDVSKIADENTRQIVKDLSDQLVKAHRNISDDMSSMQNVDTVDSLPGASEEYRGRTLLVKGSGTGSDKLYIGISTGAGGHTFKEISI